MKFTKKSENPLASTYAEIENAKLALQISSKKEKEEVKRLPLIIGRYNCLINEIIQNNPDLIDEKTPSKNVLKRYRNAYLRIIENSKILKNENNLIQPMKPRTFRRMDGFSKIMVNSGKQIIFDYLTSPNGNKIRTSIEKYCNKGLGPKPKIFKEFSHKYETFIAQELINLYLKLNASGTIEQRFLDISHIGEIHPINKNRSSNVMNGVRSDYVESILDLEEGGDDIDEIPSNISPNNSNLQRTVSYDKVKYG